MLRPLKALTLSVGGALLVVPALTGCGDDADAPTAAPSPSTTARVAPVGNASSSVGPVPKRGTSLGPGGNSIKVGNMAVGGEPEQAILRAYLRFWVERAKALRRAKVNRAALGKVATGEAAERVVQNAADLASSGEHAEGGSTVNVSEVLIDGDVALLKDCFEDRSVVVDSGGDEVAGPGPTLTSYRVTLVRSGDDRWRVSELVKGAGPACKP